MCRTIMTTGSTDTHNGYTKNVPGMLKAKLCLSRIANFDAIGVIFCIAVIVYALMHEHLLCLVM